MDEDDTPLGPERTLMLLHVPPARRAAVEALWRLDARLGAVLATTTEPAIGIMRLAWWRDALIRLDGGPAPAEPVLQALAAAVVPQVAGSALATIAEGWGAMVDGDPAMLDEYGRDRGGGLFRLSARLLGASEADAAVVEAIGAGWALVDLGWGQRDPAFRLAALEAAERAMAGWNGRSSAALRPLGMLGVMARRDVAAGVAAERLEGSPGRIAVMLRHRLFGR